MQSDSYNKPRLYIVVLGGRTRKCHIELHDVRWVVGNSIEDTFPQLINEWFGDRAGLHIDSYMEVRFIDGYLIKLKENLAGNNQKLLEARSDLEKDYNQLWFVNVGGYDPTKLHELHEYGLFIAKSSSEAKYKAKQKLLKGSRMIHGDDIFSIGQLDVIDDCHSIHLVNGWNIEILLDNMNRSQKFIPDWYGYRLIATETQGSMNLGL